MKVLLLGSTGMAGIAFQKSLLARGYSVFGAARTASDHNCDLTDESQLASVLKMKNYDAIINSAALVDIDYCEENPIESWKINAKLLSILSNWSQELNTPLLHISTDHFYTYGGNQPHKEEDPIFCVNEYARHKFCAEAFALMSKHCLVLRTSILGPKSSGGKSLIEWAVDKLLKREPMELFYDAWTSSLDVNKFADLALKIFFDKEHRGIVNVAASEVYSKEELIRRIADMLSISHQHCTSGSIKGQFSSRPNCLGLDVSKVERLLGESMPKLDDVCSALIKQLNLNRSMN